MSDALKTGSGALLAFQRAIATTAHNIANSATTGYTRQRVEFEATAGVQRSYGSVGQGVSVNNIKRLEDSFAQKQLFLTGTELARVKTLQEYSSQLDNMLADNGLSLTPAIDNFFAAISDANNNPADMVTRNGVVSSAGNLVGAFSSLYQGFESSAQQYSGALAGAVDEINSLSRQIADINQTILSAGNNSGARAPSDLLDQRNNLISRLADEVGVTTMDTGNGGIDIYIAHGQSLITGGVVRELKVVDGVASTNDVPVAFVDGNDIQLIGEQLSGGKIGGLFEYKRTVLNPSTNALGRLAHVVTSAVNSQHELGVDMDGVAGQKVFSSPPPYVAEHHSNTGSASVSAEIMDARELSTSDYEVSFDGATYSLKRLSNNAVVTGGPVLSMDGISVAVSGSMAAGDSFIVAPTRYAAREIAVLLTDESRLALGSPLRTDTGLSNSGNATAAITNILDPADPEFTNPVNLVFNDPPDSFDITDKASGSVISSNNLYTAGEQITLNGWAATINGTPQPGDTFTIEPNTDGVSSNSNGLLLAEIQQMQLVENSASLAQAYGSLISNVGTRTRQADLATSSIQGMHNSVLQKRDNVSGVNLDEEAINLSRYQQAYQAAAQIISTADEMFQSLLGAIR